ncbi:cellulose biosynthesis cyclic di-GMP-binding regulatory protein BcsB [Bosea sp. BK604]|uniref:cellulose biosynthesis cyclic di-GMP-binding regulatory protein BcsB n=1 Tax=Bosea sp. BK604 TaxID=2512180 RepID=UPI0010501C39|nr:cellulose biosynthesis cyclic di-GMP-binding regulatory protein BcsB [Bosea sp. BK604]TCR65622.1 cellulose synthase subunit [Bosea sp. BK604]
MRTIKLALLATVATLSLGAACHAQSDASANQTRTRLFAAPLGSKPAADAQFRPLAATPEVLVLRGEYASDERAVFLSSAEVLRATAFRVAFSNAVSNLPEGSRLAVRINDQTIGEVPLDASWQKGNAVIAIPPGVLAAGFNSVRFVATQRHRVDCSVAATYELWTEIATAQSGFVGLSPAAQVRRLADLPALVGTASEMTEIRLRLGPDSDTAALDRAMRAANALILNSFMQRPKIEAASEPGEGPGLDLVIGGAAPANSVQLEPDLGLFLGHDPSSLRNSLTIQNLPGIPVETTLARLEARAAARIPVGTAAGRRALANTIGRRAEGGSTLTFADLGLDSRTFDGRFLQTSARFSLPPDFFAAPYGNASLTLDSSFMGEARAGKLINIRVNDQIAAVIPINQRGSGIADQRRIDLPIQMFKPGFNTLTFEANLAGNTNACDATLPRSDASRLFVGGTSKLSFGALARVEVYPNLSATLGRGFPYSRDAAPIAVAVSGSDARYLDGALTWVGRMTSASGTPVSASFHFGQLDDAETAGLFFGPPSEASQTLARTVQRNGGSATASNAASRQADLRLAAAPGDRTVQSDAAPAPMGAGRRLEKQPAETAVPVAADSSALDSVLSKFGIAQRLVHGDLGAVTSWLQDFGLLDKIDALDGSKVSAASADGLLILQDVGSPAGLSLWRSLFDRAHGPTVKTMVLAADPAQVGDLIDKATSTQFWGRIAGEVSVVKADAWGPVNGFSRQPLYLASEDVSPANIRLSLAGWLSLNRHYYIGGFGLLAVLLALSTAAALRTRRP